MVLKKITTVICFGTLLLTATCQDTGTAPETVIQPPVTTTEKPFGVFKILIDQDAKSTGFSGKLYNDNYPIVPWDTITQTGSLFLLVPTHPLCTDPCGSQARCVTNDNCVPFPSTVSVGTITISGVNLTNGATSFTSKSIKNNYSAAVNFANPPFSANDTITLSAAGDTGASPFELKTSGIEPIVLLNDTVKLIDGEPIDLSWTPPGKTGTTVMHIEVDISYHGGTAAIIAGDCEDNGSLHIPADMLAKLKSYGTAGFPKITMNRSSSSPVNASPKVQFIIEATRQVGIVIPGQISCEPNPDGDEGCPNGQTCHDNRLCM
jgi:hypothetical protein